MRAAQPFIDLVMQKIIQVNEKGIGRKFDSVDLIQIERGIKKAFLEEMKKFSK